MPRAKNKQELQKHSTENRKKLFDLIDAFSEEEVQSNFDFEHRDKNVRDVLSHLHHWHLMMIKWYDVGMGGEKPQMPELGYTWRTTADLNLNIWRKYQQITLEESKILFEESFALVQQIIDKHNNEELFVKKRYSWTRSTCLGSYLISATSSHYDWAIKLLKKHKKMTKRNTILET